MTPTVSSYQPSADTVDTAKVAAMRLTINRLAKAQSLAWQALTRADQHVYLATVDRLEKK